MEPLNMHGHANTCEEELAEVCRERDTLRETLKWAQEVDQRHDETILRLHQENKRLRDDNERLTRIADKLINERERV